MLFLLRPHPQSFLGQVFSSLRSALMVGVALVVFPYVVETNPGNGSRAAVGWDKRITGDVTHVRDGDTIELGEVAVRLANLDCAERDSVEGKRAAMRMWLLAGEGKVTCDLEGRKSYDREIGLCHLSDGRDMGRVLISEGLCRRWQ
ncbi:MAG: hypothetical protein RIG84_14000 [Roseovarius sp.]